MKKYRVYIKEINHEVVEVEAETADAAEQQVDKMLENGEFILGDYNTTDYVLDTEEVEESERR